MKNLKMYFIVAFIISIVLILTYTAKLSEDTLISKVKFEDAEIEVEIADSGQEMQRGLMFREELASNRGMLFVYKEEKILSFWMKNTLIGLDILFINNNLEIVDIIENMTPCKEESVCPSYSSKFPAKYALEVNSGFVKNNSINIGEKVVLE
jgi:uncharacterized protein